MNSADVFQLQNRFTTLRFDGDSGLIRAHCTSENANLEVFLQGAQVAQFQTRNGDDLLFTSRESQFKNGKPIRGGVPVIFPWFGSKFGDSNAPAHGFARVMDWEIESAGENFLSLVLESNQQTLSQWPHPFRLSYRVQIEAEKLRLHLQIHNSGAASFTFESAFHTYLRVGDVRQIQIDGLDGKTYLDKVDGGERKQQIGSVSIGGEVDRVYLDSSGPILLRDGARTLQICDLGGVKSTVVWNPHIEKSRKLSDLGDDEWTKFVSIESGAIADNAVWLDAGQSHEMSVEIAVVN